MICSKRQTYFILILSSAKFIQFERKLLKLSTGAYLGHAKHL